MKIIRGGMVGAGAWAEVQLQAWQGVTGARIVALCDRRPERLAPLSERFGIPQVFTDFESMLNETVLDFVDICTRPSSHAGLTKMAAARGLPVLCQKPFCTGLAEAEEVVSFCDQAGTGLMINENFRWQAWYRQTKEILDSGLLGDVFAASLRWRERITLPDFTHAQAYFTEMPRLTLYELGVHYLDTFRYLFGEPHSIFARLHKVSPAVSGEDVALLTLNYPAMTAHIYQSWASIPAPGLDRPLQWDGPLPPPVMEIDGTQGTLVLLSDSTLHLFSATDHRQWSFSRESRAASRIAAQQHFIDALKNGVDFETSGADTLKTMALVYAGYRSAEECRVIDLHELQADS